MEKRHEAEKERVFYAQLPTVAEAARQAALALTPDGKRHSHQSPFRVRQETLHAWAEVILNHLDWLTAAETFEELYVRLESLRFKSVVPLIIYYTAYRLGAKLDLEPVLVYLHSGTLHGAILVVFSKKQRTLDPRELPTAFQTLRPYEIEYCLCMYKKEIAGIVAQVRGEASPRPRSTLPEGGTAFSPTSATPYWVIVYLPPPSCTKALLCTKRSSVLRRLARIAARTQLSNSSRRGPLLPSMIQEEYQHIAHLETGVKHLQELTEGLDRRSSPADQALNDLLRFIWRDVVVHAEETQPTPNRVQWRPA